MESNNTLPRHRGRRSRRNSRQGSRNCSRNSSLNRGNQNNTSNLWRHPNDETRDFGHNHQNISRSRRQSLNSDFHIPTHPHLNGNTDKKDPLDDSLIETDFSSPSKASQRQGQKKKQKMKDINRKGEEKEGTEMDAFTETNQDLKEKPAPPPPANINNPPPALSNKISLSEKISKIKDLEELQEKKIVSAKNEENSKVSALSNSEEDNNHTTIIEKSQPSSQPQISLKHKYKEDQWSPINPGGKKKYGRDFLILLQHEPESLKKPENLPNLDVVLHNPAHKRIGSQSIYQTNRGSHDFTPTFIGSGHSLSRGQISNRKSQQGNKGGKGSSKTIIHLLFKDEVKLRETENAWKPARLNNTKDVAEEEKKTQDLYKRMRSILNKLTPQKFDTLVSQVKTLPIDTPERLQGVIDLVFDKATDEPGFAKAYANLCKLVANMEVQDVKTNDGKSSVVFRKLLLARCQNEFESNRNLVMDSDRRLREIKACPDAEKKKELQLNFEEEERRIRRKSVGNIRFIGELYKLQMLTSGIMHRCIQHLLSQIDEEPLECLCKLFTTIGKDLENAPTNKEVLLPSLEPYFYKMGELAHKRENSKISSRVRFMLQDVIELRQNKWVPRRDDNNPKTIDQIQRDADRESLEMTLALSAPRKQDVRGSDSDRKGRNRGNNDDKDGWTNAPTSKSFRPSHSFSYELSRIKSLKQQPESSTVSLGSQSQFNQWGCGANIKSAEKSDNRIALNNMYGPLSKERDGDKKHSNINRSGKMTPSPSIEKERMIAGTKEDSDRQSHRVHQSSQPPSRDCTPTPARVNANNSVTFTPAPTLPPLTAEEIERKAKLIAQEYLCNNNNFDEAKQSLEELDRNLNDILYEILIFAINKNNPTEQASIGKLYADFIDIKFLSQSLVMSLYEKLCEQIVAEEWIIDIPLIWNYFSYLIAPLVKADKITFADLRTISKAITENKKEFFLPLLQFLCKECSENWVRNKWVTSRVQLADFVANPNDSSVQKAVEFLSKKSDPLSSSLLLPMEEVQKKLVTFLQNKMDYDSIVRWICKNVGEKVKEPQFIRALTNAICESPTSPTKTLLDQSFEIHDKLIKRFIDHAEDLEIECLCTIQAYINKLEHPPGLLLTIFTRLCESNTISCEAFIKWRDSDCVEEGKGVAIKSLTSFFLSLSEGDSDEAS